MKMNPQQAHDRAEAAFKKKRHSSEKGKKPRRSTTRNASIFGRELRD
jgi:hypothetical protein